MTDTTYALLKSAKCKHDYMVVRNEPGVGQRRWAIRAGNQFAAQAFQHALSLGYDEQDALLECWCHGLVVRIMART